MTTSNIPQISVVREYNDNKEILHFDMRIHSSVMIYQAAGRHRAVPAGMRRHRRSFLSPTYRCDKLQRTLERGQIKSPVALF